MIPRYFLFTILGVGVVYLIMWVSMERTSIPAYDTVVNLIDMSKQKSAGRTVEQKVNSSKWIVVTSIQYPTEDVKNLASQEGWTVVVVADTKTPTDWSLPGVHFLSVKDQASFGSFAQLLPFQSYTRKNLGYLYAMLNGAQWIYDTDDDNKPYGLGLAQFDYRESVSGLRYMPKSAKIAEKLFNPYQFYGFKEMWPRGFPLEHLKEHTNGKDRLILCKKMKTAAVQQGVVHNDPDVDAIYRLQNADKQTGLHVTFNPMAPPVILEEGTYSPWNSQNTLFHYRAFFTMFLPTSVAFRATDIWRSYFSQKLLHLIGEEVAFYPVNAVQYRNAHNYLKDFDQELEVYEKSGQIVQFLDDWDCTKDSVDECTVALAQAFAENEFWEEDDYELVKAWIKALQDINYDFPPMKYSVLHKDYRVNLTEKFSGCREANIDFGTGFYHKNGEKDNSRAERIVQDYEELMDWCERADKNSTNDLDVPLPLDLASNLEEDVLQKRGSNVLVLINNYPWTTAIGLLQRIYSRFFGTIIFCGTWIPTNFPDESLKIIEPINFINISRDEMRNGYEYSYCFSKVRDLRLQNVKGYFFIGDDTMFNFWVDVPLDKPMNPQILLMNHMWWLKDAPKNMKNLLEDKYKDDPDVQRSLKEVETRLREKGITNQTGAEYLYSYQGHITSDWMFIPPDAIEYMADVFEIMSEAGYFIENQMAHVLKTMDFHNNQWAVENGYKFKYDWYGKTRGGRVEMYSRLKDIIFFHPVKTRKADRDLQFRARFCKYVFGNFVQNLFMREEDDESVEEVATTGQPVEKRVEEKVTTVRVEEISEGSTVDE